MKYILLILLVVIMLPPLVHGYVYPNLGDDSAVHLATIDMMSPDGLPRLAYWGQAIVGVPLNIITDFANVFTPISLDATYMWWSYLALAAVAAVLYMVLSSVVNRWAGIIAAILVIFGVQGVMYLFYYGVIFDIVNMFIILPLAMLFLVRWLVGKGHQWENIIFAFVLFGLFCVFHESGVYMPAAMGIFTVFYLLYGWYMKSAPTGRTSYLFTPVVLKPVALVPVVLIALVGMGILLTVPLGVPTSGEGIDLVYEGVSLGAIDNEGVSVPTFLFSIVGIVPITLGLLALVVIIKERSKLRRETWLFLGMLLAFGVVLAFGAWWPGISPDPSRQAMDLAGIVAIGIAVLAGVALTGDKMKAIAGLVVVGSLLIVSIPNMQAWFGYNSAVTEVDMLVMRYINGENVNEPPPTGVEIIGDLVYADDWDVVREWFDGLRVGTYTTSPQVAPWIYNRFLNKDYVETMEEADFVIVRDEPMTPRSDPDNVFYKERAEVDVDGLELLAGFDGMRVYEGGR